MRRVFFILLSWKNHRELIIHVVPQITFIDGVEVTKSERIKSAQNYPFLLEELRKLAQENPIKKLSKLLFMLDDPDRNNPNKYSKEYRRKMYKEMEEEKIKKEKERNKKSSFGGEYDDKPKEPPSIYKENGELRVCNQGRFEFFIEEDIFKTGIMTFELKLPK